MPGAEDVLTVEDSTTAAAKAAQIERAVATAIASLDLEAQTGKVKPVGKGTEISQTVAAVGDRGLVGERAAAKGGVRIQNGSATVAPSPQRHDTSQRMPRADAHELAVPVEKAGALSNASVRARTSSAPPENVKRDARSANEARSQAKRALGQNSGKKAVRRYSFQRALETLGIALLIWLGLIASFIVVSTGDLNIVRAVYESKTYLVSSDAVSLGSAAALSLIIVLLVVSLFSRGESSKIADEVLRGAATGPLVSQSESLRREVGNLAEKLETVIVRASDLELVVRKEITALEGAYSENEQRTERLLKELEQQRHKIVQHVIDVKNEAKELEKTLHGNANAAVTLLRATHEEVVGGLSEAALNLREALKLASEDVANVTKTSLDRLSSRIAEDLHAIEASLDEYARRTSGELGEVASSYKAALKENGQNFERGLRETFAASAARIDDAAARLAEVMRAGSSSAEEEFALAGRAFDAMILQKARQADEMLKRSGAEVDRSIAARIAVLNDTIAQQRSILSDLSHAADAVGKRDNGVGNSAQQSTSILRREGELASVAMEEKGRRVLSALQSVGGKVEMAAQRALDVGLTGPERRGGRALDSHRFRGSSGSHGDELDGRRSAIRSARVVPFPSVDDDEERTSRMARLRKPSVDRGVFDFVTDRHVRRSLEEVKREVDRAFTRQSARLLWAGNVSPQEFKRRLLTSFGREVVAFLERQAMDRTSSAALVDCCASFIARASRCQSDDELLDYLLSEEGRSVTLVAEALGDLPSIVEEIITE